MPSYAEKKEGKDIEIYYYVQLAVYKSNEFMRHTTIKTMSIYIETCRFHRHNTSNPPCSRTAFMQIYTAQTCTHLNTFNTLELPLCTLRQEYTRR